LIANASAGNLPGEIMSEVQDKALAIQVIRELWPNVRITESHVTPDVAEYVFQVLIAAKEGHQMVNALSPFVGGPIRTWGSLAWKLTQAVRKYANERRNWGLAIRAGVATHERGIQAAMTYGTEVYPLKFR